LPDRQALPPGQLVEDDVAATVVRRQRDLPVTVGLFDLDAPVGVRDRSLTAWHASREELLHTRQTRGDVITGDTALVARTHRQLCTRLTDRVRGDDAHRLADIDQLATAHRTSVAAGAD